MNHPTLEWHKILGFVMHKYRHILPSEIIITLADTTDYNACWREGACVLLQERGDSLSLKLVSQARANAIAEELDK